MSIMPLVKLRRQPKLNRRQSGMCLPGGIRRCVAPRTPNPSGQRASVCRTEASNCELVRCVGVRHVCALARASEAPKCG